MTMCPKAQADMSACTILPKSVARIRDALACRVINLLDGLLVGDQVFHVPPLGCIHMIQ